jgi:hypothetical protein
MFYGLEIKKPGETARPDQLECHDMIRVAGGKCETVDSIDATQIVLKEWGLI